MENETTEQGPLAGLRVIELAGMGPGPFAAMTLADLGAEVIRVDRAAGSPPVDRRFEVNGRSRRSIALDLKSEAGRDIVLRLVAGADALIEGMRPGGTWGTGGRRTCSTAARRITARTAVRTAKRSPSVPWNRTSGPSW